jgi:D-alanyl-D-alanine carboxypeptidase/D-alanyl-D-alanine-endopeptidase (penicillin-binding protein 4)
MPDPALLCAEHLYLALSKLGIKCDKKKVISRYEVASTPEKLTELTRSISPPLPNLIYHTNQTSSNLYCESLLFTLGDFDYKKGMQKLRAYWQSQGIDSTTYQLEDASGLSRGNTVSAQILTQALLKIYQSKSYESFNQSLPVAGKDGSMASMGKKTFIENNLRAKTGYVRRARSYAGYVKTRSGKTLAFSILVNHYDCSAKEARKRMEKFLVGLAEL